MNNDGKLALLGERVFQATGIEYELEHRFHPVRRWRFDIAFPAAKVALEVDGGVFIAGRHTRGAGFIRDQEKFNEATLLGWRVYRTTWKDVNNGTAENYLRRTLRPEPVHVEERDDPAGEYRRGRG